MPSLDYAISVWRMGSDCARKLIQKQHNLTARIVFNNYDYIDHDGSYLCDHLKWKNFDERYKYATCCMLTNVNMDWYLII